MWSLSWLPNSAIVMKAGVGNIGLAKEFINPIRKRMVVSVFQ